MCVTEAAHPAGDDDITRGIVELLAQRATSASICPSEVARSVAPANWRAVMPRVRAVAAGLAMHGRLRITQGARDVDPRSVLDGTTKGPLRLRRTD